MFPRRLVKVVCLSLGGSGCGKDLSLRRSVRHRTRFVVVRKNKLKTFSTYIILWKRTLGTETSPRSPGGECWAGGVGSSVADGPESRKGVVYAGGDDEVPPPIL